MDELKLTGNCKIRLSLFNGSFAAFVGCPCGTARHGGSCVLATVCTEIYDRTVSHFEFL